jgi:hypothetical protein
MYTEDYQSTCITKSKNKITKNKQKSKTEIKEKKPTLLNLKLDDNRKSTMP